MSKEICISTTPHETRLAIIEDEQLTEVYYERENEYTLAGSIYKGRVTRVLPGMQSAFVDVGLERDAFLYVTDFLDEQEDSAEFERIPANGSREERGQGRSPRSQNAGASANPVEAATPPPQQAENFEGGTRRWRGRRGRRGRGQRQHNEPQGQPQIGAPENSPVKQHEVKQHENGELGGGHERGLERGQDRGRDRGFDRGSDSTSAPSLAEPPAVGYALPGESLSKYGGQSAQKEMPQAESRRQPVNYIPAKPATLIETPLEWDGMGLLPGESRSRRGNAQPQAELPAQPASHSLPTSDADAPVPDRDTEGPIEKASGESHFEPLTGDPGVVLDAASAVPEAVEYEPEDAEASYRVDPVAPSEFRISPPLAEPAFPEEFADKFPDKFEDKVEEQDEFPSVAELEEYSSSRSGRQSLAEPSAAEPATGDEEGELPPPALDERMASSAGEFMNALAGSGLMEEEEVNDEEEYDFTLLYDSAEDHDLEDMEEETLDRQAAAGAEIEEFVRDKHLDRRIEGETADSAGDSEVLEIEQQESELEEEEDEDEEAEDAFEQEEPSGETAAAQPGQPPRNERRDQRRGQGGRQLGRRRHNGRRQSAQTSSLPIISELLKQGQEILVQIAKEPIAKKGARITSHIALPGRFLVFMPTVNHVGVSRKISSDEERQRLKRILISEKGEGSGGFIVRTAADGASEDELRADIRFLISLWTEIKQRADSAKAPALIYHDLNLVERILRDQVSDNFSTIWVDSETEYERIVRFLNRFEPGLVRHVKLYTKETPLFEQFGIQEEIGKALKSKVWLKSGGSIVINQTEALVAIDINTGKYVGKTARLEDTILKTNLDAIPEIVRQIRLRDLGGIIVIDFIDMDERKNRHKVMQALEEALKADRAPSKVLQFNDFGLVAITRKRVKQSLERTLCVPCAICTGTGMTKKSHHGLQRDLRRTAQDAPASRGPRCAFARSPRGGQDP